jgi:hypothetical protein
MAVHSEHSSYREKLLEHLLIGEVLRYLWRQGVTTAEFLRPEVDRGGYDLVIACGTVIRHIQLKSSHRGASTSRQNVNIGLADKPSGCVVWVVFDEATLALGPFLWFGGLPGQPLPDIRSFPVATHTRGNAQGVKGERPNIRILKRAVFEQVASVAELVGRLFGRVKAGGIQRLSAGPYGMEHTLCFTRTSTKRSPILTGQRPSPIPRIHFTRRRPCAAPPRTPAISQPSIARVSALRPRRRSSVRMGHYSATSPTVKKDC